MDACHVAAMGHPALDAYLMAGRTDGADWGAAGE